jgi:hypothetical protein
VVPGANRCPKQEPGEGDARVDAEDAVHTLDVLVHGVTAEAERLGDLAVAETLDDQHGHLAFARRERDQLPVVEPWTVAL